MGALIAAAALAAQATGSASSAPPPTTSSADTSVASQVGSITYVDLEGGAGYSTNPNLSFQSNSGAAFGRLSVHAVHTRVSARTTTVLSGFAQASVYSKTYGTQKSLDLNARHDAAVTEQLHIFGDVDFAYDQGGQLDTRILGTPQVPLPPGTTVPPVLLPPGSDFLTVTGRSYRAAGHLGAQWALGPVDSLNLSSGVEHTVFKGFSNDLRYTTVPVTFGYERRISTRTSVGARVTGQFTDYNGPVSSRVITPQVTIQTLLSPRLSFEGAVGASFVSTDDGVQTVHSTGISANASLCSTGEHSQFCGRAAIDEGGATVAGPTRNLSFGLDYSRQLDADQTLSFSLDANRYSPLGTFLEKQFTRVTYFRAAADYSRKIGHRLFSGLTVAGRKIAQNGPDPRADISASLFLRYRLGDLK
jgi:hypothetical protein